MTEFWLPDDGRYLPALRMTPLLSLFSIQSMLVIPTKEESAGSGERAIRRADDIRRIEA
jgi:hypothetical protein